MQASRRVSRHGRIRPRATECDHRLSLLALFRPALPANRARCDCGQLKSRAATLCERCDLIQRPAKPVTMDHSLRLALRSALGSLLAMPRCDCGGLKSLRAESCHRCGLADGDGIGEAAVIGALRSVSGPASLYAIALEAELSTRQVLRVLERLLARGRVRKLDVDGEALPFGSPSDPDGALYGLAGGLAGPRLHHPPRSKEHAHAA